jgi:hypothetical protein
MENEIQEAFVVYRFGIKYEKFDHIAFGITLNFYKIGRFNFPCLIFDCYKYSYTFGWCEVINKKDIIK